MMTGRRRNELNTLTDCLVYAGFTAVGFSWLENIFYIASGETLGGSLAIAGMRLLMGPFAHPLFTPCSPSGCTSRCAGALAGRLACLLAGYLVAVLVHGLWNGSAMLGAGAYLGVYVLWMMPVFALAIVLALTSRSRGTAHHRGKLPALVAHGLRPRARRPGWGHCRAASSRSPAPPGTAGGRPPGGQGLVLQVVALAYTRDRIDRGFGDARVFAPQEEEAQGRRRPGGGRAGIARSHGYRFPVR